MSEWSNWALLGMAIAGLVLWFWDDIMRHYHECPKCHHIWSHRGIFAMWSPTSHTCPTCGTEEYVKTYEHPCKKR